MNQNLSYGDKHRSERKEKLNKVDYRCAITNKKKGTGELQAHHTQPRVLGFFDKGDIKENYIILTNHYHEALHKVTRLGDDKDVTERQVMAKRVWNNPDDQEALQKMDELDEKLIPEFLDGLLNNLSYNVREKS